MEDSQCDEDDRFPDLCSTILITLALLFVLHMELKMNIEKLIKRVDQLENKNELVIGKYKDVVRLLKEQKELLNEQEERIKELESTSGHLPPGSRDSTPVDEDLVSKHPSGLNVVLGAELRYLDREKGYSTFRLPDGRGFVVTQTKWADPREGFGWKDLEIGQTYEKLLIHDTINIEEPIRMRCYLVERYDWKFRVKWQGRYGDVYTTGVLNTDIVGTQIRESFPDGAPLTKNGKGEELKITSELRVLPWYVKRGGWDVT